MTCFSMNGKTSHSSCWAVKCQPSWAALQGGAMRSRYRAVARKLGEHAAQAGNFHVEVMVLIHMAQSVNYFDRINL